MNIVKRIYWKYTSISVAISVAAQSVLSLEGYIGPVARIGIGYCIILVALINGVLFLKNLKKAGYVEFGSLRARGAAFGAPLAVLTIIGNSGYLYAFLILLLVTAILVSWLLYKAVGEGAE